MIREACELRKAAREALAQKWGSAVVLTLVATLISLAASSIPMVGGILSVLLLPMTWSYNMAFLDVKRNGGQYEIPVLKEGYNDFTRVLGTVVLQNVYIFLWTLLLIVPGIIKSYSYGLTIYILRDDKELSFNAAIEKSMAMMEGHKAKMFYLDLTFIGWVLLAIVTCGIGLFWVAPYMAAARVQFYEDVKAEYEAKMAA